MNASTFFIGPPKVRPGAAGDVWTAGRNPRTRLSPNWQDGRRPMPARLRPTAPIAADAVLVGDPGRALLLAQELLEQPKMSNHARGLWGYSGRAQRRRRADDPGNRDGRPERGPGPRRPGRARCPPRGPDRHLPGAPAAATAGELLLVERAIAEGGSAASFGLARGEAVAPDPGLTAALGEELGARTPGRRRSPASTSTPADAGTRLPAGAERRRPADGGDPGAGAGPGDRRGGDPDRRRERARTSSSRTRRATTPRNGPDAPPRPYSNPKVEP